MLYYFNSIVSFGEGQYSFEVKDYDFKKNLYSTFKNITIYPLILLFL